MKLISKSPAVRECIRAAKSWQVIRPVLACVLRRLRFQWGLNRVSRCRSASGRDWLAATAGRITREKSRFLGPARRYLGTPLTDRGARRVVADPGAAWLRRSAPQASPLSLFVDRCGRIAS